MHKTKSEENLKTIELGSVRSASQSPRYRQFPSHYRSSWTPLTLESPKFFHSPEYLIKKCKYILTSNNEESFNDFIQEVLDYLKVQLNQAKVQREKVHHVDIFRIFFGLFNLFYSFRQKPDLLKLFANLSEIMKLYFDFVQVFKMDYTLSFIPQDEDLINIYQLAHRKNHLSEEITHLNRENEPRSPDDLDFILAMDNIQKDQIESDTKQKALREHINGEKNNNYDIEIKDQSGDRGNVSNLNIKKSTISGEKIKHNPEFCVDLALVDVLELIFTNLKGRSRRKFIGSLYVFYEVLGNSLLRYLRKTPNVDMALVNKIAFCAISSIAWICEDQNKVPEDYLPKLAMEKTQYIEFFLKLVTLNLYCTSSDIVPVKLENYEPLLKTSLETWRYREKSENDPDELLLVRPMPNTVLKIIPDKQYNNPESIVIMYQDLTLVKTSIEIYLMCFRNILKY